MVERNYPLTSIIILTYNQLIYTEWCLASLYRWTGVPFELIIVDNGSTDGTISYLKKLSQARLIINKTNYGFARGVNQGIKASRGENILLLNNDTIVGRNWLSNLLKCLYSNPGIGIVGPRSNGAGGEQGGVECPGENLNEIIKFSNNFNRSNPGKWFATSLIVGFCMLIRGSIINEIGLFDENYTYGLFEDADYCKRVEKRGYQVICAGDTFVYHFGSRTIQGNNLNLEEIKKKNGQYFWQKWSQG